MFDKVAKKKSNKVKMTRQDKIKHTEQVIIYLTPAQKERLIEAMLKDSYDISLSTFIRKYLLKNLINVK